MIDEFIKEIEELKKYKHLYECQCKDKQRMSDILFELMMEKYHRQTYYERCELYCKDMCRHCKYVEYCDIKMNLPKDIRIPIESKDGWIPANKTCGKFEWS